MCRSSTGLGEMETLLLKGTQRLSCALGPRAKQRCHNNLGQAYLWFLEDLLGKQGGDCGSLWGKHIGIRGLGYNYQHECPQKKNPGKIWPHPSGPRPNKKEGGNTAIPFSKLALPKVLLGTQLPLTIPRDKAPVTRGIRIYLHLPEGRHQSLPSGSLQ